MRRSCLILAAGWLCLGGSAAAAPVPVNIVVGVHVQGIAPITFQSTSVVSVEGTTISVPAGAVALTTRVVVPATATTALFAITASSIRNQAGTFSLGGVTQQSPGELCPPGGPAPGAACNQGGGVGGVMGLMGTVNVHLVENQIVIPVVLEDVRIGLGGGVSLPFTFDAAAWSTGRGVINTGFGVSSASGGTSPLTLVSPTYVSAIGNLLPIFATITFTVPEPGALALLGVGLFTLIRIRRR